MPDDPVRFVGPSYEVRRKEADVQRAVNLFPAVMEVENGKTAVYLRQVPGLRVFSDSAVLVLTSLLYPIFWRDNADVSHAQEGGEVFNATIENVDVTHALTGGTLLQPLKTYEEWPVEAVDVTHALTAGDLVTILKTYEIDVENVDVTHALTAGALVVVLLTYSNWPVENVDVTHALAGGSLT